MSETPNGTPNSVWCPVCCFSHDPYVGCVRAANAVGFNIRAEAYAKGRADQLAADRPWMQHLPNCHLVTCEGTHMTPHPLLIPSKNYAHGCSCGLDEHLKRGLAAHLAERTDRS